MDRARVFVMCFVVVGLSIGSNAYADVFKCANKNGQMAYQDVPCASANESQSVMKFTETHNEGDAAAAALFVYGLDQSIRRAEEFCELRNPSTMTTLRTATQAWRFRHKDLVERSLDVMHVRLSDDQKKNLDGVVNKTSNELFGKIINAPRAQQKLWCENLPMSLNMPALNLVDHKILVNTLNQKLTK